MLNPETYIALQRELVFSSAMKDMLASNVTLIASHVLPCYGASIERCIGKGAWHSLLG